MKPAQDRLAVDLGRTEFADLRVPLINNVTARQIRTGSQARQGLVDQVSSPVRWTETLQQLVAVGVERTIEVGPGAVLSGLLKNVAPMIRGMRFGEAGDLAALG